MVKTMRMPKHLAVVAVATLLCLAGLQPTAQDTTGYPIMQGCLPDKTDATDGWTFTGVILTHNPDEGVRALRSEVATTYYVAFAGSNFTEGGAVSPDGAWYAVPYGVITTLASSDVRYSVNEIRVFSTETVPQLRRRIGLSASYQFGDIPALRWLDGDTLLAYEGRVEEGLRAVTLDPFADTVEIVPSDMGDDHYLSPDGTRALRPVAAGWGLFDATTGDQLTSFPTLPPGLTLFAWTADSATLATIMTDRETRTLDLLTRDGDLIETALTFPTEQVLWNFAWSPDGSRFAFSLYDPQDDRSRLHIGDRDSATITDLCADLTPLHSGADGQRALAWSPDGGSLAIIAARSDWQVFQIIDFAAGTRYAVAPYTGAVIAWGAN